MDEAEKYLYALLQQQGVNSHERFRELFLEFITREENINYVKSIKLLQENMTKNWQVIARREDIKTLQVAFPNGNQGKAYKSVFDFEVFGLADVTRYELTGFEGSGLVYDPETKIIEGIPENSGDIILDFHYNFEGEPEDAEFNHKKITIIINPDPKSLWKDIPSDANGQYAVPDQVSETVSFLGHTLVVASNRGRSHAIKGSYRDDSYAYAELPSGWGVIAISDGAGSAKFSRKGAEIACRSVIEYLQENFTGEKTKLLDEAINIYSGDTSIMGRLQDIAFPYLSAAAKNAYTAIEVFANENDADIGDFHATLSFALVKKYEGGYAFLSFGVGDCPIVLVAKDFSKVTPLNVLDSGDFGGGTRFITMPEIFRKEDYDSRFRFEFVSNFPYVVLMSDGIYDPKFEVAANLAKPEKWEQFFKNLQGNNDENVTISFDARTSNIDASLLKWMDFWSPGNHDDRTLAILF